MKSFKGKENLKMMTLIMVTMSKGVTMMIMMMMNYFTTVQWKWIWTCVMQYKWILDMIIQ